MVHRLLEHILALLKTETALEVRYISLQLHFGVINLDNSLLLTGSFCIFKIVSCITQLNWINNYSSPKNQRHFDFPHA